MKKKILTTLCTVFFAGAIINNATGNVFIPADAKLSSTAAPIMIKGDLTIEQGTKFEEGARFDLGASSLTVTGNIKIDWEIEADRWYSIGFPFDVTTVFSKDFEPKGWDPELIATTTGKDGDYYLKEYKPENGKSFKYVTPTTPGATLIKAGKGYIVQFPYWFNKTTISFIGSGTTLTKANDLLVEPNQLVPNTNLSSFTFDVSEASGDYLYYKYDDIDTYNLVEGGEITLSPFEALLVINKGNGYVQQSFSVNDEATGIKDISTDSDDLIIDIRYYTLQGVGIQHPTENGIYIEKKIYKSGKEEGIKRFNNKK